MANKADTEGGTEELDKDLSTRMMTENEVEHLVNTFSEAVQTSCWNSFPIAATRKNNNFKKSVPWWTDSINIIRKRVNAFRRLYQRTRNDEKQRETRKK
jgi:hypothetical protein